MASYDAVPGKCVWWREVPHDEDRYNINVKAPDKRVVCSCFVEGYGWEFKAAELPKECPRNRECRYYVKGR